MPAEHKPDFVLTIEAGGSCPGCHQVLPRLVDCAPAYFKNGHVVCQQCGEKVDLWLAALSGAIAVQAPPWALQWLGAGDTHVVLLMETGTYYEVQLTEHGAPPDAKILSVNCTSQGGSVTALPWHGNEITRRFAGTALRRFAVPLGEGSVPRVGRVAIKAMWIRGEDSDAWPYLITAFEAAAAKDYAPSMVFAQSAVEVSMMPLIEGRFRLHAPEKKVKRFTNYGRALDVILPYICGEAGIAQMPTAVHDALVKLKEKRNKIIHVGVKAAAITAADAMEGLCAAAFGFEYMRYVGPFLAEDGR